jgi:hypothetical protein
MFTRMHFQDPKTLTAIVIARTDLRRQPSVIPPFPQPGEIGVPFAGMREIDSLHHRPIG